MDRGKPSSRQPPLTKPVFIFFVFLFFWLIGTVTVIQETELSFRVLSGFGTSWWRENGEGDIEEVWEGAKARASGGGIFVHFSSRRFL